MVAKPQSRETLKRLRQNDLAKQLVIRYRHDPLVISMASRNRTVRELKHLADEVWDSQRMPESIAEWIALVFFYGDAPEVHAWRTAATTNMTFIRAERWLKLIDQQQNKTA